MSSRRRTKGSSGGGFAALLVLGAIVWVIMFIVRHIWVILGILVVVASIYLAKAIVQENRRRQDAYARYCADIAAKADQQDDWVAAGDERGIYGPGAVDLMRYIRSGGKEPPAIATLASTVVVPKPLSPARRLAGRPRPLRSPAVWVSPSCWRRSPVLVPSRLPVGRLRRGPRPQFPAEHHRRRLTLRPRSRVSHRLRHPPRPRSPSRPTYRPQRPLRRRRPMRRPQRPTSRRRLLRLPRCISPSLRAPTTATAARRMRTGATTFPKETRHIGRDLTATATGTRANSGS